MTIRVRFAPSPTGYMHLGNTRTALFNWLYARGQGGVFVLRIEDTDQQRHVEEAEAVILEGLRWLGLDWDEGPGVDGPFGPYRQSERRPLYHRIAQRLIDEGRAYLCRCDSSQGDAAECSCSGEAEAGDQIQTGIGVRFRNPGGETAFTDIVKGEVSFENQQFGDYIILKSDGTPTYNFACAVDDHAMKITHVLRGDDHLSNTPRQIMIYRALGHEPPRFGHLPQILAEDGSRLSKRHGAVALTDYQQMGFLADAMCNYLALLGWSPKTEDEFRTREQLVADFRLEDVRPSASQFSLEKLIYLNSRHLELLPLEEKTALVLEVLKRRGWSVADIDRSWLAQLVEILGPRLRYGEQILEYGRYFLTDDVHIEDELHSYFKDPATRAALAALADRLESLSPWDDQTIEQAVRATARQHGLKAAPVIHGTRVALSGKTVGPSLFSLVRLVGRERAAQRLRLALRQIPPEAHS